MSLLPSKNPEDLTLGDILNPTNVFKGDTLFGNILNIALALGGGIAVIFILIGAFQYFTAFGNEEKANKGKTTVMWAIIGVIIIILAKVVIYEGCNLIYGSCNF